MNERTQAWQFQTAGHALVLTTLDLPQPKVGQLLIKNDSCGVNPVDWKFVDSNPLLWPQGHVPGVDGCGVVIAVGDESDKAWLGQRVSYHHSLPEWGSFAMHTLVYAERVMRVPSSMSSQLASALPCPMLTAWQAFMKVPVIKHEKVLVTGMGAVNKILAQLLSRAGFEVHVLSKSLSQEQAHALGITHIHRDLPQGIAFYALFDANGPEQATQLIPQLMANGHVVSILGRIDTPIDAPFTRTISYHEIALGALHQYGIQRQWQQLMRDGEDLLESIAQGQILVDTPQCFDFAKLNEALHYSKSQQGKAVVNIA